MAVVALSGCLDLDPRGKVFACPGGSCDAGTPFLPLLGGGTGGASGGSGGGAGGGAATGGGAGTSECACQLPSPTCDGNTRISPAASLCLSDGGCEFQLVETSCPSGCTNGACVGEPCLGVVCSAPPAARCASPTALIVFTAPGSCSNGGCSYASAEVSCDCQNDRCTQNPCLGVFCNQPPAASCVDANLQAWQAPGACDAATGRCTYASAQIACGVAGCNDGRCNADRCAGVTCNQPPAATCLNSMTVQRSSAAGTCNPATGACSYTTETVSCQAGTQCLQGSCVTVSPTCNPSNCAGCCNGDTCVPVEQQSAAQCGSGAAACGGCGSSAPVCENGACVNRCAGVSCNQPPGATCFDSATVTQWSGGTCDPQTGACSYVPTNVTCGAGNTCSGGVCSCVSESQGTFCARNGATCGAVTANDNCGVPRTMNCGTCTLPQTCNGNACSCMPEPDSTFCSRLQKNCGQVSGTDNCGAPRTASCGTCGGGQSCGANNVCSCTAESNAAFCSRLQKNCGTVTGNDNCGAMRTTSCGSCTSPQTCGASNVCACVPETNATFCSRQGKNCGTVTAADNCGTTRSASCGTCGSGQTCSASNVCTCAPESDAAFCSRNGKNCGSYTGTDNCGATRTAACGSCTTPQTCGGGGSTNVCGGGRLIFSTSWQTIPNTGSQLVEFRCAGTVSTTTSGGTRCSLSGGDPVQLRIDGSVYDLYPGCDGDRPSNCMTSITPSGATYASWGLYSAGPLLCDAMGWSFSNSSNDNNPGTVGRPIAVVQTAPSVIGTASGLKNYATYVNCNP